MKDTVRTRHAVSGAIDENTPRHVFEHAVIGKHLEEVGPNAKPYLPEMHRTSLPAEPTDDQIAVAVQVGAIEEADAKALATDAKHEGSTKELEAKRVALQAEAEKKDKK